jgi:hypothetical protein
MDIRKLAVVPVLALAFSACSDTAAPDAQFNKNKPITEGTVTYLGNGFISHDGGVTWEVNDERCGLPGEQGAANDGGTGQFEEWNYESGDPYLLWIFTGNGATNVKIKMPGCDTDGCEMFQVGGTWKFASPYFTRDDLLSFGVTATYEGTVRGNITLTVSHGCGPYSGEGAWCSPGYWKNARQGAWNLVGGDPFFDFKDQTFEAGVMQAPDFAYFTGQNASDIASATKDAKLIEILGAASTFSGSPIAYYRAWAANAYNMTGAYLTDQIPGYEFDPDRIGTADACPIDNHGNFKTPEE